MGEIIKIEIYKYNMYIYGTLQPKCNDVCFLDLLAYYISQLCFQNRKITISDQQRLAAGRWFSLGTPTNKTDWHDITKILLKVALNTLTLRPAISTNSTSI